MTMTIEQHAPEHVTDEELSAVLRALDAANKGAHQGWADHDYFRTMAGRACRELRALRAPVDVTGEVERLAAQLYQEVRRRDDPPWRGLRGTEQAPYLRILRPHVERAAVLAREVATTRDVAAHWNTRFHQAQEQARVDHDEIEDARSCIEQLRGERDALAREAEGLRAEVRTSAGILRSTRAQRDSLAADLDAARAEIERLNAAASGGAMVAPSADGAASVHNEDGTCSEDPTRSLPPFVRCNRASGDTAIIQSLLHDDTAR